MNYMNKYCPFLKFNDGELTALFNLSSRDKSSIIPMLEIPRDDKCKEDKLIRKIDRCAKRMSKNLESSFSLFIDNLEVPDNITINGYDNYLYIINSFSSFDIIPVIGFDRVSSHNDIGIEYANKKSKKIALRVTQDYYDNFFAYKRDLDDVLKRINSDVINILLLDCNYIDDTAFMGKCKMNILKILYYILKINKYSKIILCGSSIPSPIGNKVKTGTSIFLTRNEILLYKEIVDSLKEIEILFGDYTVVSPGYAEINIKPEAMYNVITPKIIYSKLDSQFVIRGYKIKTHGLDQYFSQAETIIKESFYRGDDYSYGDKYLYEKAKYRGKNITPSSIIGPTVNAHIKYMIEEINKGTI